MAFYTHDYGGNNGTVLGDPTEKMRITANGYIGIGTAGPVSVLHVESDLPYLTLADTAIDVPIDAPLGILNFYSGDASANSEGGVGRILVASETAYNTGSTPSYMAFYTHNNSGNDGSVLGNTTEKMRITANGNVGIGTMNPQTKLHIGGTAGTDGIMFPDGTMQLAGFTPSTYTGGESVTFPNGMIFKGGVTPDIGGLSSYTLYFQTPFSNGILTASATQTRGDASEPMIITSWSKNSLTIRNNTGLPGPALWQAWGY